MTVLTYTTYRPDPGYLQIYTLDKLTDSGWQLFAQPESAVPVSPQLPQAPGLTETAAGGRQGDHVDHPQRQCRPGRARRAARALPGRRPSRRAATLQADRSTLMVFDSGIALGGLQLHGHQPRRGTGRRSCSAPRRRRRRAITAHYLSGPAVLRPAARPWRSPWCRPRARRPRSQEAVALQNWLAERVVQVHAEARRPCSARPGWRTSSTSPRRGTASSSPSPWRCSPGCSASRRGSPTGSRRGRRAGRTPGRSPPTTRTPGRNCTSRGTAGCGSSRRPAAPPGRAPRPRRSTRSRRSAPPGDEPGAGRAGTPGTVPAPRRPAGRLKHHAALPSAAPSATPPAAAPRRAQPVGDIRAGGGRAGRCSRCRSLVRAAGRQAAALAAGSAGRPARGGPGGGRPGRPGAGQGRRLGARGLAGTARRPRWTTVPATCRASHRGRVAARAGTGLEPAPTRRGPRSAASPWPRSAPGTRPAPTDGSGLRADSAAVRRAIAAAVPRGTRWRARLLPASVLGPMLGAIAPTADLYPATGSRLRQRSRPAWSGSTRTAPRNSRARRGGYRSSRSASGPRATGASRSRALPLPSASLLPPAPALVKPLAQAAARRFARRERRERRLPVRPRPARRPARRWPSAASCSAPRCRRAA